MEMKPEARVACQVMLAVLFTALFITAIAFAGECRSFSLTGNVSEIFWVVAFVTDLLPCSWGRQSPLKLLWEKDVSEQSVYRRTNPSPWCGS